MISVETVNRKTADKKQKKRTAKIATQFWMETK